jgi:hypothetical protein
VPKVVTFAEAVADAEARFDDISVLLGNGFSIDYAPTVFAYESLADEAELPALSVDKDALFAALGSSNFEVVIDKLRAAATLQGLYGGETDLADALAADAVVVRNGLADVLMARHPASAGLLSDDEVLHARTFLSHFSRIFTLSYDLLLYWVVNRPTPGTRVPKADGFEWPSWKDNSVLIWKSKPNVSRQRVFFLHGALHYFVEERKVHKMSYGNGPLVAGLRRRLTRGQYPLVVTEGTRDEKEARIDRSAYLRTGLRRFGELGGAVFIHGVSMSPNDDHVLELLETDSSEVDAIYVGIHGSPRSAGARTLMARAEAIKANREANGGRALRVKFYDTASAQVWR